jgi:Coenzyme PQQ synthesis protein D (PqqD)
MVTLEQQVQPDPDVVDTELEGGETVLLDLKKKLYFSLNPTGSRIWQGLKQNLALRQISERLQQEFTVEAERADRSVLDLVNELCQQHLVKRVEE